MAEANKQSLASLYDELKDQTDIARDYSVDFTMGEKAKLGITEDKLNQSHLDNARERSVAKQLSEFTEENEEDIYSSYRKDMKN